MQRLSRVATDPLKPGKPWKTPGMEFTPWKSPGKPWNREAPLEKKILPPPSPHIFCWFGENLSSFFLVIWKILALMRHSVSVILNKVQIDISFYSFLFWVLPCAVLETITKFSVKSEKKSTPPTPPPNTNKQQLIFFLLENLLLCLLAGIKVYYLLVRLQAFLDQGLGEFPKWCFTDLNTLIVPDRV